MFKTMKFLLLVLAVAAIPVGKAFAQDTAFDQNSNYTLDDARLIIGTDCSKDPNSSTCQQASNNTSFVGTDFDYYKSWDNWQWYRALYKYDAQIQITEVNSNDLSIRKIIIPVIVKVLHKGIILKVDETRGVMGIHGIKGKPISALFGQYGGAEVSVAAVANFGEANFSNGWGVSINDFQTLVVGLGLDISHMDVIISPNDTADVTVTVSDTGNRVIGARSATLDQLMNLTVQ